MLHGLRVQVLIAQDGIWCHGRSVHKLRHLDKSSKAKEWHGMTHISATWNCWDVLRKSEYNATGGGGHCPYWSCRTICTWRETLSRSSAWHLFTWFDQFQDPARFSTAATPAAAPIPGQRRNIRNWCLQFLTRQPGKPKQKPPMSVWQCHNLNLWTKRLQHLHLQQQPVGTRTLAKGKPWWRTDQNCTDLHCMS